MDPVNPPIRLRYDVPDRARHYTFVDAMSSALGVLIGTASAFALGFVYSDGLTAWMPAVPERIAMGGLVVFWLASSIALCRNALLRIRRGQRAGPGDDESRWTFWRRPPYRLGFQIGVGVGCFMLTVISAIGFALPIK